MRCVDVNVLVYAHRPEADRHDEYRGWLEAARVADEPLGLSDLVLSGFIWIVTHPRVFREPSPRGVAFEFADTLRASPSVIEVQPGPRHWSIFQRLCNEVDARGNLVPDAFLAALAVETGSIWCTADRGFARFGGLRVQHPLDAVS